MTNHIVIIGSALSGNKGAAAMLESSIQTISETHKDAKFTLFSMYPSDDKKQNTYKNLEIIDASPAKLGVVINSLALLYRILPFLRGFIAKKSKAIGALAHADVLLDQGGITFVDGREKFLIYNIASILPALMVKTPVVKCAQAMGPFKNPINKICAKIFLPRVEKIVSRGAITQKHLDNLGLTNVVEGADYAFLLDLTDQEKAQAKKLYSKDFFAGKQQVVGISPSVVMQKKVDAKGKDYAKTMSDFINKLIKDGYKVALIPHSARTDTDKTHNNDLPLCREIYANIDNPKQCLFIDSEASSQELRAVISKCDLFVSSRFHAMISSLAMSVPTLVIGWSHKYREVLAMFNLEKWAFGADKLSTNYLYDRFIELAGEQKQVRYSLKTNLPKVKDLAKRQVVAILDLLEK